MLKLSLPDPQLDTAGLFLALLPLASVLLIAGFWNAIIGAQESPRQILLTLVKFAALVALMSKFDVLIDSAQEYVADLVTHTLHAEPDKVADRYLDLLNQRRGVKSERSIVDQFLSPTISMVEAILAAIMLLFSIVAGWIMAVAYLFQKIVLQAGYALCPLFLPLLGLASVRSIGVQYLLGMAGVVLWPLGWAVASLVTNNLIDYVAQQSFLPSAGAADDLSWATRTLLTTMLIGLWVIFSTVVAPWVMQRAITTGAQVGNSLLSAGASAGSAARNLRQ